MPPTLEQEKNRQVALANIKAGRPQNEGVVTANDFKDLGPSEFKSPQQPAVFPVEDIDVQAPQLEITAPEAQAQSLSDQIRALQGELVGQSQFAAQQEQQRGVEALVKEKQDLANQIRSLQLESKAVSNQAALIPAQVMQESAGRGITIGGAAPNIAARQRIAALKQAEIASKALTLQASFEAASGNLSTALDLVDRAVAQRFDPIKEEIAVKKANLQIILDSPAFSLADKNRALRQDAIQQARLNAAEKQEQEERGIKSIAMQLSQVGNGEAARAVLQGAATEAEALFIASGSLQDPIKRQQLVNLHLDNQFKSFQIERQQYEFSLLKKYGGLTPQQYIAQIKKDQKENEEKAEELRAQGLAREAAQVQTRELENQVGIVDAILSSPAIAGAVGPTPFARDIGRGGFGLSPSQITGSADDLLNNIVNITDNLFLDKLISVKGQGATFGQLSNAEGEALRKAATRLQAARICDGENNACTEGSRVIGYDMTEKQFRQEVGVIRERLEFNRKKWSKEQFPEDEKAVFDAVEQGDLSGFDPSF